VRELDYPDRHFLSAALGWLDLGCTAEALAELGHLTVCARFHPEAMVVRWRIHARGDQWQRACDLAKILTKVAPNQASGWVCLAYSLFRMKRALEAWIQLVPQARAFPKVSAIPFLLACFASKLGHARESQKWLAKSGELGGPTKIPEGNFAAEALALLSPHQQHSAQAAAPTANPSRWETLSPA
jgi:hypothetical protein